MLSITRHDQRAPADQAGAQQRRDGDIVAGLAERKAITGVRDEMRGKAAVARVAGEARAVAEVFPAAPAIGTFAAGIAQPGNADPLANPKRGHTGPKRVHPADHLMAGDDRIGDVRQFSIDDMQIGPAHAAGTHLDAHFAGPGHRICPRLKPKRRAGRRQDHGVHLVRYPHASVSQPSRCDQAAFDPRQSSPSELSLTWRRRQRRASPRRFAIS